MDIFVIFSESNTHSRVYLYSAFTIPFFYIININSTARFEAILGRWIVYFYSGPRAPYERRRRHVQRY